jgi:hypothetical protein
MDNFTPFTQQDASDQELDARVDVILDNAWSSVRPHVRVAVRGFIRSPISPAGFLAFELLLLSLVQSLGRLLLEGTLNGLEPLSLSRMPHDLVFEGLGYRRVSKKSRNANVITLFGRICLCRCGYRYWQRGMPERMVFPLELMLGLVVGATPALAEQIGLYQGDAGATQRRTIELLRQHHGVSLGVKRLRAITEAVSEGLSGFRHQYQVEAILAALKQATNSRGSRKPVLAVGRDGCTLCENRHSFYEVATAATISVFDRAGKRLTTVYLAHIPEAHQTTMSHMLTSLLTDVLKGWQGPLPTLAYVADSGGNECSYFQDVLRRMFHPRTGRPLQWQRVVDYYHVAERVWSMASSLFGSDTKEAASWARRMLKALKKPSGASRVLHSAASHFHRRKLSKSNQDVFWKSYRYLQKRTRFLRYSDYKARHIPLGSGITEAACKTIYTQRLKLSGMRWSHHGAQLILNLRVIMLSRTWKATYTAYLQQLTPATLAPYASPATRTCRKAA